MNCIVKKIIGILTGIIFLILSGESFGQDYFKTRNNIVTFPSPKAWSFMNYGNYSVSHYTGTIDIGVDLFSEKVQNFDLKLGVSYNFLDNKPSTLPSQLGLGFSLNIGGCVTRVVRGFPDEKNGYIANSGNRQLYQQNSGDYVDEVINRNIDNEPDIFYYKFGNYTGSFYFDHNKKIVEDNFSNMKINIVYGTTDIYGVVFVDPQGVKYEFMDYEQSSYLNKIPGVPVRYNSAWWLTKITFPNSETIDFEYYPTDFNLLNGNYLTAYELFEEEGVVRLINFDHIHNLSVQLRTHFEKYLKKVTFPTGSIDFSFSNRQDKGGEKAKKLDEITVLNKDSKIIKRFNFSFYENQTERFKLKKIMESNGNESTVLREFVYNSMKLPWNSRDIEAPYYSDAVDFWGFYNGELGNINQSPIPLNKYNNNTYGKAIRTPRLETAKAEILEKIIYPTGGFTSFEYELNDFNEQGESYSPLEDGQLQDVHKEFFYEEGVFSQDPYTMTFTLTEKTTVSLVKRAKTVPTGTNIKWINRIPGKNYEEQIVELAAGTYNLGTLFNANYLLHNDNSDVLTATAILTYKYKIPNNGSAKAYGGGLRIGKVINNDGINSLSKRYLYRNSLTSDASSGILTLMPTYLIDAKNISLEGYFSSSTPILSYNESETIGYAKVFEVLDDGSYTEYNYTSFRDYPDEIYFPMDNIFFKRLLCPRISEKSMRGKLTGKYTYSSDKKLLMSEEYNYSTISDERTKSISYILVKPLLAVTRYHADGSSYSDNVSFTFSSLYSKMLPFRVLSKKTVKDFSGIAAIEYTEEYEYSNPVHSFVTATKSINSKSDSITNLMIYPLDYSSGMEEMVNRNIVGTPIENISLVKSGGTTNIVSGQFNKYDNFGVIAEGFDLNKRLKLSEFKVSNQLQGKLPDLKNRQPFSPDVNYSSVFKVVSKSVKNKPQEIQQLTNHTVYIWGYNGQYPIAEIKNATYAEVETVLTPATIDNLNSNQTEAAMETLIKNVSDKLRSDSRLAKSMVTTYTYSPLVGMTSKTDPRGIIEYYKYDGMQRLQAILDHLNYVSKSFDYHYRSN
ncbi:hypothetical protein [Sphingobacterium sp.]|uniref:hypothetical protein n=1 Tax=Sphingobacterium sp. TaxID=341027 RepID=UPI0031D8003C